MVDERAEGRISDDIESLKRQIDEFKRLQGEWEKSEKDYKKRTQSIYDVIYEIDSGGIFTFISDSIERYGYKPDDLVGKHFKSLIHPQDIKKVSREVVLPHYLGTVTGDEKSPKLFDERRSGDRMTKYLEVGIVSNEAKGSQIRIIVELHAAGKWDTDDKGKNKFVGSIGIIRDITERKKAEEELKSTYSRIEHLYKDLEEENKRLDELSELKSGFVANASHEIRTPLAVIKESVGLFIDYMSKDLAQEQKNILSMTKTNIDKLANMVNSLLDASKIEAGKLELDKEEINIKEVIANVVNEMKCLTDKKDIIVSEDLPQEDVSIFCDKDKIGRVLTNLISNALKFTDSGGNIKVECHKSSEEIRVAVLDTGCGIAEDDIPKLFDKYSQFGKKKEIKGTGLGLSIAKGIIEMHDGEILVESKLGEGSKFCFTLPRLTKEAVLKNILSKEILVTKTRKSCFSILSIGFDGDNQDRFLVQRLKEIADDTLRRKNDVVYELSNKIVVVLPNTDKRNAFMVLVRIKENLKSLISNRIIDAVITYPGEANNVDDILSKLQVIK
ncbi:MAG: PAS domain-containing sensor histidine kinase [Candidatus Kaelpia aquatica]|nr:PAS domain-containing sensor histidine kinase [Candidatus Kaelpia aquatica]